MYNVDINKNTINMHCRLLKASVLQCFKSARQQTTQQKASLDGDMPLTLVTMETQ